MKKADNFNPAKWLVENKITFQSRLNEIEYMPDTDYEDNWEKGGGMDDEEADLLAASIIKKGAPIPGYEGQTYMNDTLVVDETGDEFQEFYILNTPEDEENLKNDQENGREIEGIFKVKMDNGEIKTAVVYPPTSSKSEFYGKFNEGDLKKYKGLNAALALINENKNLGPDDFDTFQWKDAPANPNAQVKDLEEGDTMSKEDFWDGNVTGRGDDSIPSYGSEDENGVWTFSWDSGEFEGFVEGEDFTL
jgi:hypothetical protein